VELLFVLMITKTLQLLGQYGTTFSIKLAVK